MPVKPVIGAAEIAAGFPKPDEPPNERSRFNDDKGAEGLNLNHFKNTLYVKIGSGALFF